MSSSKDRFAGGGWHSGSHVPGAVLQSVLVRYATSLALTALVVSFKWAIDVRLGTQTPFFVFFVPLLFIGWFAGLGPSVVSAVFVVVAVQYVPLTPGLRLASEPAAPMRLVVFLLEVVAIGWLAASRRAALIRVDEMERRYRTLAENIPQCVWVSTPDGNNVYQNSRLSEFSGRPTDETLGWSWKQLVHPEDIETLLAAWGESLRTGSPLKAECRMRAADGAYHWFVSRAVPMRDAHGEIVNWFGTATDIDQEKRAQESMAHLAAIVETSDIAILGMALDGAITSWNFGAERIYGYSAVEMIGRHVSMLAPSHLQNELRGLMDRIRRGERVELFETTRVRKDGHHIPVSLTVSLIHDPQGRITGISTVARDITARKLAVRALRESEERFRVAANTVPVMIWMRNTQGAITFYNKTYAEFVGCATDAVLQHDWVDSVHLSDQENYRETFCSALRQCVAYQMEYRARRADGEFRWIAESVVPRYAAGGAFDGFIGSCVDITNRKWAEQTLRGAFDELEVQAADSRHELQKTEHALRFEQRRREQAEEILKKLGL